VVCLALLTLAGCTKERTFSAEEFVDEVNAEGVELSLGGELSTVEPEAELYAVELEPLIGAPPPGKRGPAHTGGSLAVYEDTAGASDRLEDCRNSVDLLCYQAANVVVILEQGGIEADRLGVAMRKLAD
jgi:hypothetical protein